ASDRVLQYREVLKRLDGEARFYHRSFAVDELGTAATLLAWRDQWHLHGWQRETATRLAHAPSRRLRDMAEVEASAAGHLAPGIGERLALVAKAMETLAPRVDRLELTEPLATWPQAWQRVLARLNPTATPAEAVETAPAGLML